MLIGNSILKSTGSPCADFVNLALTGAMARDVPDELIDEVTLLKPELIVFLIGINDLRLGESPVRTAQSISALVLRLSAVAKNAQIVVLALLPIIQNDTPWAASNLSIRETMSLLREMLPAPARLADFAALFGKEALAPELTADGLHLNENGLARLSALIRGMATGSGVQGCP